MAFLKELDKPAPPSIDLKILQRSHPNYQPLRSHPGATTAGSLVEKEGPPRRKVSALAQPRKTAGLGLPSRSIDTPGAFLETFRGLQTHPSDSPEFLEALEDEILKFNLVTPEVQDRHRREREALRRAQVSGEPTDLDVPTFLASLDPGVRQDEQDEEFLDQLPQAVAAEARAVRKPRFIPRWADRDDTLRTSFLGSNGLEVAQAPRERYLSETELLDRSTPSTPAPATPITPVHLSSFMATSELSLSDFDGEIIDSNILNSQWGSGLSSNIAGNTFPEGTFGSASSSYFHPRDLVSDNVLPTMNTVENPRSRVLIKNTISEDLTQEENRRTKLRCLEGGARSLQLRSDTSKGRIRTQDSKFFAKERYNAQ